MTEAASPGEPLAIDLYCGLGGWAEGLLSEGWRVIGFDIERHRYPRLIRVGESAVKRPGMNWSDRSKKGSREAQFNRTPDRDPNGGWEEYPGQLVLQDVRTLRGSQFRNADLIVASPPCQAYSYRAMPWKRAKALPPPSNELFDACFRIQREASEAAGRHIPMIVENVRGAQKWVGKARANFGSFYLWGDVGMVGRRVVAGIPRFGISVAPVTGHKLPGFRFDGSGRSFQTASVEAQKFNPDGTAHGPGSWFKIADSRNRGARKSEPLPGHNGSWFGDYESLKVAVIKQHGSVGNGFAGDGKILRLTSSKSPSRKAASALIAKIPFPLAQHIARVFKPEAGEAK